MDVGADFLLDQVETIQGANWLEFCGVPAPIIPMISIEQQFAENLHTYTLLRGQRVNSRPKDLIDLKASRERKELFRSGQEPKIRVKKIP